MQCSGDRAAPAPASTPRPDTFLCARTSALHTQYLAPQRGPLLVQSPAELRLALAPSRVTLSENPAFRRNMQLANDIPQQSKSKQGTYRPADGPPRLERRHQPRRLLILIILSHIAIISSWQPSLCAQPDREGLQGLLVGSTKGSAILL